MRVHDVAHSSRVVSERGVLDEIAILGAHVDEPILLDQSARGAKNTAALVISDHVFAAA